MITYGLWREDPEVINYLLPIPDDIEEDIYIKDSSHEYRKIRGKLKTYLSNIGAVYWQELTLYHRLGINHSIKQETVSFEYHPVIWHPFLQIAMNYKIRITVLLFKG